MSSEENKSKFEKINNINSSNPTKKEEENHEKDNLIKQNLISSKTSSKQKNETITNLSDSNITTRQNNEINQPFNFPQPESNSSLNENSKFTYFQSKKINILDKRENQDKPCCCCTKTKCIKKYCECFSNNRYCKDCHCIDCMNKFIYLNNNVNLKESFENEKIFCTCAKSNCNKKYCECYKSGKKCNDKCRCVNCLNNMSPTFNIINKTINNSNDNNNINNNKDNINLNDNNIKDLINENKHNINLDEEKSDSRKSSSSDEFSGTYKIQRISVFINQFQTLVNVEKFSNEDMRLISKKRCYNK